MFRIRSNAVATATALILLASVAPQAASADDELAAAVRALVVQIAQMEERLDALEARDALAAPNGAALALRRDSDPEPAPGDGPERAELEYVAAKVEALEARLVESQTDETETQTVAGDSGELAADSSPTTMRAKSGYLPSHGWHEGMYYGSENLDIQLHAFVNAEYVDPEAGDSTFDTHHANFFITAGLRENLRAHTEFEFEHSGDTIEVDQAYLEWAPKDWLTLTAGRYYSPFGIERFVWYPPTNALVSRPEPLRQIVPGNFYANGLMLSGNLGAEARARFTYEVSLANGLGADADTSRRGSRQNRDNNSDKALTARLGFSPNTHLEFGASHHSQDYDDSDRLGLEFTGIDVAARWSGWEFRGEYVDATIETELEDTLGEVLRGADFEQDGWYGQLGYTYDWFRIWLPSLTLVTRFDSVDLDAASRGAGDRDLWSLGLNAAIYEHFRFKAEYRMIDEEGPANDQNVFLSQFVIDF